MSIIVTQSLSWEIESQVSIAKYSFRASAKFCHAYTSTELQPVHHSRERYAMAPEPLHYSYRTVQNGCFIRFRCNAYALFANADDSM